jgi:transposase
MYVKEGMSTWKMAEALGVSQATVARWLHTYEVPMRPGGFERKAQARR